MLSAGNWGIVNRNTIGSPIAILRSGPFTPPVGKGALNLTVKDGTEKVAFGNEVDFAGDLVEDLQDVGFHVYTTGENSRQGARRTCRASRSRSTRTRATVRHYSSLVFMPDELAREPVERLHRRHDDRHLGRHRQRVDGPQVPQHTGAGCTFAELMDYLDDGGEPATILTAAVTKGRDSAWQGAVDGLRINDTVFDFEETGVFTTTP